MAIDNDENSIEIIQTLLHLGSNPLEPNQQKLYPYHFAQSQKVFESLTPPPVEPRALVLTLARSLATEEEKIELLDIININQLPLVWNKILNKISNI